MDRGQDLTCVFGQRDDLGKKFGEVRQVVAEKAGLKNKCFPGMCSLQLATKKFRFAIDAQGRSSLCVLMFIAD